jgi:hypothetical protein
MTRGAHWFAGEYWWGGYVIHLAMGIDGYRYKIRHELALHAPRQPWRWSAGPFPSAEAAHQAAVSHIIEIERSRASQP